MDFQSDRLRGPNLVDPAGFRIEIDLDPLRLEPAFREAHPHLTDVDGTACRVGIAQSSRRHRFARRLCVLAHHDAGAPEGRFQRIPQGGGRADVTDVDAELNDRLGNSRETPDTVQSQPMSLVAFVIRIR